MRTRINEKKNQKIGKIRGEGGWFKSDGKIYRNKLVPQRSPPPFIPVYILTLRLMCSSGHWDSLQRNIENQNILVLFDVKKENIACDLDVNV